MENKILYLCDGRDPKCEGHMCKGGSRKKECTHTSDINHARNFERWPHENGVGFVEKEPDDIKEILQDIAKSIKKQCRFPKGKSKGNQQVKFFPPNQEEVYIIHKWYADAPALGRDSAEVTREEDGLVGLELRIFLSSFDWCKFQEQPFYPELIQYLDSLRIQKEEEYLRGEKD